jgi:uncharacterized coiled-coil protein SlyX
VSTLTTPTSTKRKRCDEVQTALVETQQARKKLSNVLDLVINRMDKFDNQNTKTSASDAFGSSADDIINLLIETNEQKQKLILIPLTGFLLWRRYRRQFWGHFFKGAFLPQKLVDLTPF